MKPLTTYLPLIAATLMALACAGCAETGPESRDATLYNIVELTEMDAGTTTFALYSQDSDTPATLTCRGEVIDTTAVHEGNALYLGYMTHGQGPDESGEITPVGYARINNLMLQQADMADLTGWNLDPLSVESLWRAGSQVFMRLMLPYDDNPRQFALIVDKATLENAVPDAYLLHRRETAAPTFTRRYYAAVQLRNLWSHSNVTALRIHVATATGEQVFTISTPLAH